MSKVIKFCAFIICVYIISLFFRAENVFIYKMTDSDNQSLERLTISINSDPNNASLHSQRGKVYSQLGPLKAVILTYINPPQMPPTSSQMSENDYIIRKNKKYVDLAISDFSKAIEIDPNQIDALNYRAVLYFLNGEIEKSLGDVKTLYHLQHPANSKFLGAVLGSAHKQGIKTE